jgi:glycerol-3-phosphate dehydrogenase (NAD(P)+)
MELSPTHIAVVGGGSWATAIVKILSENNVIVHWWLRSQEDIKHIKEFGHNPSYLSAVQIDGEKVKPTSNLRDAIKNSEYIVLVVPSAFISDALKTMKPEDFTGKKVVNAIKGMVLSENSLVTSFVHNKFQVPNENLLVIAGPCHAEEVALERQSYLTIAGQTHEAAAPFASLLACRYVKTITNEDVIGVQFCAVHKNIVAIACGIARGLNYGDNYQSVLVSNAMQEAKRFTDAAHALDMRDMNASAYLGDLLVTAYSQFSRNRTFGNMIGRGYTVKSAQMEMNMIAEGYYAVKGVHEINKKYKTEMPIVKAVYNILYERISPAIEMRILKDKLR